MEPAIVDGNGTETGHIIVTTIGGRNGQPKQVTFIIQILFLQLICNRYVLLFVSHAIVFDLF